jgi:hypothetical protein
MKHFIKGRTFISPEHNLVYFFDWLTRWQADKTAKRLFKPPLFMNYIILGKLYVSLKNTQIPGILSIVISSIDITPKVIS